MAPLKKSNYMKKLLITFLVLISLYASAQKTYYVSASGNDTNDGSQGSPIKTINKAISLAVPGDRILLNGGDAFYGGVIPKSGTINAPITFGSYGIGKAIITGFSDVTGWSQVGNIWTSAISVSSVNMVIINGSFAPIGKWPNGNKVYNTITSSTSNSVTSSTITGNWTGGQLVIRKNHWIIDKGPVTAQSGSTVTYTPPNTTYNPQPGWGFFIQNHQSACDQQNEWFFSGGKLGIYSASQPANVKACTTDNLVQVNANAYINFFGLQFVGSNAAAVTITSGHDIIFESCVDKNIIDTFCNVKDDGGGIYTYTGTSAVVYSQRFVTNNIVQNGGGAGSGTNTTNSDAFGIYMDGNASEVTIDSNYIQNCGSSGIFLHGNHNLTVTNNTVYNAVVTGGYGQLLVITDPSFAAPMRNVVVTGNKFVSKTASQVAGYFKGGLNDYNQWGRFDSNYYSGNKFFAGSATNFGGWQTTSGMEKQSSVGPAQTTPPVPVPASTSIYKCGSVKSLH
jgi:parallel beta-helix repeat protein